MSQAARPGGALDRLAFEMARCPFHDFLQPTPVSADPDAGTVVVRVENRPALGLSRSGDGIHGGVLAALIDIVGHATIAVQLGRPAPTIDLRIDYLKSASGPYLIATGKVLRIGRSVGRADVEITDARGAVVAVGRGTFSTAGN